MNLPPELGQEAHDNLKSTKKAIAYACRLLGSREYSCFKLQEKLAQKGYCSSSIESTIEYLLENNWQSDERFCGAFIRSHVARGKGRQRICYELSQQGISKPMMERAFKVINTDWLVLCETTLDKKMSSQPLSGERKEQQKIERFLRYRGFSGSEIYQTFKNYSENFSED